jgi:hypothetical protein
METAILTKIYENQIIANIKQKNLTPLEMAHLIDEYLKQQQANGVKLDDIEKNLGISKRILYKYRSILKLPKETLEKYQDKLSFEQMSIISYSVKDKEKVDEVMEETVAKNIPSDKLVYKVSEINDAGKISKHIIAEVQKLHLWAIGMSERIKPLPRDDQKRVREAIEDLIAELNKV